jgi:O-antigen/teichoic acid export membrane protein
MSAQASTEFPLGAVDAPRSWWAAIAANLRTPLYRDGSALVLNAGLTAVLGVAYWLLAAHYYAPRDVGVNTAAISAMMFLSGVAQLNLMSSLVRFLPILRGTRRRFIAACYLAAGVAAVGCATVFLLGLNWWAPALGVFGSNPGLIAWFVGATVAWCVFNLQDSSLTGLGAAVLVPVENTVYGIAKIALLIALVSVSPSLGIFGSWTAALLFSIVPVNLLIFGRLLRRRGAAPEAAVEVPTRKEIMRFVAPDYLAALMWLAATTLMPVLVVAVAGPTENAYFALAWMIILPLIAISGSMGVALVANAASEPQRLPEYAREVLVRTVGLTVPASLTLAIAASYVMRLFGERYAAHGAVTLSLLALSLIPNMVTALYSSIFRVQRRMRALVALQAGLCGPVLVLAPILMSALGIAGVGLAWLICQSIVAAVLLSVDPMAVTSGARTVLTHRRGAGKLSRCAPAGMPVTSVEVFDDLVIVGRAQRGTDEVFVKLARSDGGEQCLDRGGDGLVRLGADHRLATWDVPHPQIVAMDRLDGRRFVVESALDGVTMRSLLADGARPEPLIAKAMGAIEGLHRRTAELATVDSQLLELWIRDPVRAVEGLVARSPRRVATLHHLSAGLAAQLADQTVQAGWIHGDFTPGNVLFDARGGAVTGLIDWERMATIHLPAIDTITLLLAIETQLGGRQLGDLVAAIAAGQAPVALSDALARAALGQPLDTRALAMLCWLTHAGAHARDRVPSVRRRVWQHHNVDRVLDALERR